MVPTLDLTALTCKSFFKKTKSDSFNPLGIVSTLTTRTKASLDARTSRDCNKREMCINGHKLLLIGNLEEIFKINTETVIMSKLIREIPVVALLTIF